MFGRDYSSTAYYLDGVGASQHLHCMLYMRDLERFVAGISSMRAGTPVSTAMLPLLLLSLVCRSAAAESQCGWETHMSDAQNSVKNTRRLIDISVTIQPNLPSWDETDGLGEHRELVNRQDQGGVAFVSKVHLVVHTGTHFDAPSHFLQEAFDAGRGMESIQLSIMNGIICTELPTCRGPALTVSRLPLPQAQPS